MLEWERVMMIEEEEKDADKTKDDPHRTTTTTTTTVQVEAAAAAALETWNWCHRFVVRHQLCPWAKSSVETPNAMQLYIISCGGDGGGTEEEDDGKEDYHNTKYEILSDVGRRFTALIEEHPTLESSAIFFCVFLRPRDDGSSRMSSSSSSSSSSSFLDFYQEFFDDIEQQWLEREENDTIILAPFHPDWTYGGGNTNDDGGGCLDFEKRSPHPTISLVSTRIVDQAGSRATEQIGVQNEETLLGKYSSNEWQALWRDACGATGR
jgi:hypothetical protein